ncbi:efflux RND transporter permease subunit [Seongchinamella sediminis]|uniref:Efflux RND transporter permease subunit n=1 Tax=Seongchinamella sediminis TaxID=2283635 RepID=A0A3L7E097_9GAMM|nr:efflux RND transporter permease subunit [Seongchinamella sediminis]RLQ22349.1 efflux RND transporter permease subunit [Seongchinamella sediminis]
MTRLSLNNPAAIAVIVALIVVFGLISVRSLPIQLLPDVERPAISIETNWRAAAPEEVEESIIQPQEKVLRNIEGLESMVSNINRGSGRIRLDFRIGWDMQRALIDVITQLNQTTDLPADADEPEIRSGGGSGRGQAASLMIYTLPGNENRDVASYQALIDQEVEPRLSRIPGVARVVLASEREPEIHITLDPHRLAARGIGIPQVADTLRRAVDVSGGFADVGRRRYTVRYLGQRNLDELGDLVITWQNGEPIRLLDVATIELGLRKRVNLSFRNGFPAYYISMIPAYDANTVELLDALNATIDEINEEVLHARGLNIELSFDASLHIRRAIALVNQNLLLGLGLASLVLWFFLRNVRATLIIAATIPVSLLVAFVVLRLTGKTLNVISLAGLAFAVGLVMDAAIIVQENIVRLRATGLSSVDATLQGCRQVSGALFSSTLTSVAIFLPILFMVGVEGQLFKDLAITLTAAVSVSLLTALTILPAAAHRLSANNVREDRFESRWRQLADAVLTATKTRTRRIAWSGAILGGSLVLSWVFLPQIDFLPKARIDAIQTYFATPPGINLDTLEKEIASEVIGRLKPYYDGEAQPGIRGYNFASFGARDTITFIYPEDSERVPELLELLRTELFQGITDTQAFVSQSSMLNLSDDGPDAINIDIQGADLDQLKAVAAKTMELARGLWEGAVVFSAPDLSAGEAELRIYPREQRISLSGLDRRAVGDVVRTYTDGLWAGEYFDGNERYDIILQTEKWNSPEELVAMPLATPLAGIQTIGDLAEIRRGVGPAQLQRVDGLRTITIFLIPPDTVTMEEALHRLRTEVEPQVKPLLPQGARLGYRGSADRLAEALRTVGINFLLAVLILYLIMAALFRSGRDAMLVLLVMPMAIAGGLIGLKLLNLVTYQSLDLLTMIGFIILLGLVVNNAILLVDQTRSAQRAGMSEADAVHQAVLFRARPIFMSTLTSIFGMLPLMLIPGVGSEIYRGLATVIVGGMTVCAMFTLLLLPSLLRLGRVSIEGESG